MEITLELVFELYIYFAIITIILCSLASLTAHLMMKVIEKKETVKGQQATTASMTQAEIKKLIRYVKSNYHMSKEAVEKIDKMNETLKEIKDFSKPIIIGDADNVDEYKIKEIFDKDCFKDIRLTCVENYDKENGCEK